MDYMTLKEAAEKWGVTGLYDTKRGRRKMGRDTS